MQAKDFAAEAEQPVGLAQPQQPQPIDKQDVNNIVHQAMANDLSKGAVVHEFNPDATPQDKAAAAGQAKAQLAAVKGAGGIKEQESGRSVALDSSSINAPTPTVSIDDVDKINRAGDGDAGQVLPGQLPAGAAPAVPPWVKTGWQAVAGVDAVPVDGQHAEQLNVLASFVSEQAYGAWYHNAGIILFSVLATHLFTLLHLGWGWLILVLAVCASYYSLSISRTRTRARDDIQRELVKTRLVTEVESADFINSFLDRFWLIYEPVLSQTIVASVDAVLATSTPSFLESIRMTTFTLGTKAPRIDSVRTFPKTPDDVVIMDWALSFTPNDLQDITPRQAAKRVNPKIVLSIGLGKGFVSSSMPILLEDMSFSGKMRIKLKLMSNFPHVQTIDISFIEKPTFDYVLKPIGGETFGFDINNIPGLAPFIREQVHANLGPMMYDPNMFTIDLQALLSGTPLDSAIGVLKVTVANGRGFKATKLGGGAPDPYVTLSLGAKPAIARTKTIESSTHPVWNESLFILVNTLADVLNLNVYDYNDHRPDSHLGTVAFELRGLAEDASQENILGKVIDGGKERGEIRYHLDYFPVMVPAKLADGTVEPLPESQTGVVRLTLHQAKELDVSRARGDLNPSASVYLGGSRQPVFTTPVLKRANQPIWESSTEFLVPDRLKSTITIKVTDNKDFASDPSLGTVTVKLADLLEAQERQQDWFPLRGSRAGKIRLSTKWKPVAMAGSIAGAAAYVPPIGILRVWLKKAIDVKNVESALGGKSDPYVRVMGNNKILARTEVINNNLNPEWDQIIYVPVNNLRERLILELMDYQNLGKDRPLGTVEVTCSDFAEATEDNAYPFRSTGPQNRADPIKLDKSNGYKGKLLYEVTFCPCVSLQGGVSFEAPANELQDAVEAASKGSAATGPAELPNGAKASSSNASQDVSRSATPAGTLTSRSGGEATPAEDPKRGVVMSTEELLAAGSGILVLQVVSGQLARKGALEVMLDDGYWPAFTTEKARSTHAVWDQIGEGFVRELDFSRIWLRINAHDDSDKEDIVAEFKGDTREFIEQCIREPHEFVLTSAEGGNRSTIKIAARFVPVDIKLEPRESVNNMGILRVMVQNATGLLAVDRSGKSDPYVAFELDGERVWKTEVIKKTLSPVWNETFECSISSRVKNKLTFEVFDWDQLGTADTLGSGVIDIASLEPLQMATVALPVRHPKAGEKGVLNLKLWFSPEIIARARTKTSTFSTAGRALTSVGSMPLGVGKTVGKGVVNGGGAVVMGVGHSVGNVGGFAGRRLGLMKKKDKSGKEVLVEEEESDELPAGQVSQPGGTSNAFAVPGSTATDQPNGLGGGAQEPGVLTVTVIGTKDLQGTHAGAGAKAYVQLKMGKQVHRTSHAKKAVAPEWNESYSFNVVPGVTSFTVTVLDHHAIGKDKELGEADVDIWRHIQPAVPNADVLVELGGSGQGLLKLRLDWATGGDTAIGVHKGVREGRAASISSKTGSPSKFSMRSFSHKDKERE